MSTSSGMPREFTDVSAKAARAVCQSVLASRGQAWLTEEEMRRVLAAYGVTLAPTAFARTVLDTIPNIQASWVTMGMKVGQMALHYGCNDFGSLMLEENVVSAANTTHRTTIDEIEGLIRQDGFMPRRRKQNYQLIEAAA